MKVHVLLAAAAAFLAAAAAPAGAVNLVQNGDFSQSTGVVVNGQGQLFRDNYNGSGYNIAIADWTYNVPGGPYANNGGIITILPSNNLNGANNIGEGPYSLWNATNGGLAVITAPPSGNAYVLAQDSAAENTAYLSQTINGLTAGHTYRVTFNFAGAQLRNSDGSLWNGATNEGIRVNLGGTYDTSAPGGTASQAYAGGETHTAYYDNYASSIPSHGFSGWQSAALVFTATATSEVLNLEAISSATGEPPFALIDDVQLNAVPEPATWALFVAGFGLVGVAARRRLATVAG